MRFAVPISRGMRPQEDGFYGQPRTSASREWSLAIARRFQPQRLAFVNPKADAVHRPHHALSVPGRFPVKREVHRQVFDFEKVGVGGHCDMGRSVRGQSKPPLPNGLGSD